MNILRIMHWALGDESWKFNIPGDMKSAIGLLRDDIENLTKSHIISPTMISKTKNFPGYIDETSIIIRAKNKWYGVSSVFSLEKIFWFDGRMDEAEASVVGIYGLLPFARWFMISAYVFMIFFILLCIIVAMVSIIISDDYLISFRAFITMIFASFMLIAMVLFIRFSVFSTFRAKNDMKLFLEKHLS